jgi:hypothetical protein
MRYFILLILLSYTGHVWASPLDSIPQRKGRDSITQKKHSPRKAATLSAILPGAGQVYNKKYWKVPLVYAALGTCVGFIIYNRSEYIDAKNAYKNKLDNDPTNDNQMPAKYIPVDAEAIRIYRNGVRQNLDYSILAFVLCWGLNIVDAAVDGHLKSFDVSENLSLKINPYIQPSTRSGGMQLTFDFGTRKRYHPSITY